MATYQSITMKDAKKVFSSEGNYLIVDVRRTDEFAKGHIPGAINIPNETIKADKLKKLPDLHQVIYVYCRSGRRSKEAAEKLTSIGYRHIIECGGFLDWNGDIEK
ncbi:MAG: rhodanese-like domain-containing protein [Eubacteriales bacterium]|nr:rhodanese-like domain-containing protein [Eubacteriales bacterium]